MWCSKSVIYLPSLLLLVHFHSIFGFQRFIDDPGNVLSSPFVKPNNRRTVRDNNDKISSSLSDDSTIGDHEQELATPPTINIPQGSLVGSYETSRAGRTFASFKGIPYARVGQRFTDPLPPRPWKGRVLNATSFGPRCPQIVDGGRFVGTEECLFLNVFVPKLVPLSSASTKKERPFPVMVCIETGGFQFGGGDHSGPDYFMDEDVILVTFNYRVNVFGFLSTHDQLIPGNMGLKDQHLALVWVHHNIAAFGGDPSAVTIFGESAGGSAVTYQLLAPASRGLFRSAIAQSGSALISRHFTENLALATAVFADRVGCTTKGVRDMVACLRGKGVKELLQGLIPKGNVLEVPAQIFVPTLEPGASGFLPAPPLQLLRSGSFAKVPLVLTVTKDEGLLRNSALVIKSPELLSQLNTAWYDVAPVAFGNYDKLPVSPSTRTYISSRIRELYFNNAEITMDSLENLTALYSDSSVISGVKQYALLHGKKAPVYAGVFAFEGIWSSIFSFGYTQPLGIAHSDDLQYLFHNDVYPKFTPGSRLENISKHFVKSWVKFATVGIPDPIQIHTPPSQSYSWPLLTGKEIISGAINWLYLKDVPQRHVEPLRSRLKFWDFINMVIEFDLKL